MEFNQESIDFLQTFANYEKKYGERNVLSKSFGEPIVRRANAVITKNFDRESIKGVKKFLEYDIRRISWRDNIWIIPLQKNILFFNHDSKENRRVVSLLVDSLMLTIIAYRIQLNEHYSGLANIIFYQITIGFELVCGWINRGYGINPRDNELLEVFDIPHIESFIIK